MALELVSFGGLSRLFRGLKGEDQQAIANYYDVRDTVLSSWLHTLVYLRNICAHHARLWNRILTFKPKLPAKSSLWHGVRNDRLYSLLVVMQYLLNRINPGSTWRGKLQGLLEDAPEVPLAAMGFPVNWVPQTLAVTN